VGLDGHTKGALPFSGRKRVVAFFLPAKPFRILPKSVKKLVSFINNQPHNQLKLIKTRCINYVYIYILDSNFFYIIFMLYGWLLIKRLIFGVWFGGVLGDWVRN